MDRTFQGEAANRLSLAAVGVAIVVALLAAWWWVRPVPQAQPATFSVASNPTTAGVSAERSLSTLTIHVSGAVAEPGLVHVAEAARIADVILAAGGALPTADLGLINLAASVRDGEQIVVPKEGEHLAGLSTGGALLDDGMVRVNTDDAAALQRLPRVGPVLADRIVAYRQEHGPFALVEDLLDVPGIGEATLAGFRDMVIVP